jgi:acetoin utilization protein AcuB
MKAMPKVEKYMTVMPHTINQDVSIHTALQMMREHNFRHLPVLKGGKLVGVLTDRDIKLAASFVKAGEDSSTLSVEQVMTPDPFCVTPEASLEHVVAQMAEHKYGSAIVQQANGKVVGIFTSTDGMRVLSSILEQNYKPLN